MNYEQTKMGLDYDHAGSMQQDLNLMNLDDAMGRKRRSVDELSHRNYNRYTQRITENAHTISRRSTFSVTDVILANLPVNRTIMFDCNMAEEGQCVEARFSVHNFRAGNVPIIVALNFTVDLTKVGKLLIARLRIMSVCLSYMSIFFRRQNCHRETGYFRY